MPIITTQRRMAEHGRIRLGAKITGTRRDGSSYTRPDKLDRFRFTSASERQIREIASTYGGEARPWDNDGKAEFEVLSDATAIPVIVVKGGFSQWHEFWTKGGCQHRCDGEKDAAGTYCDPQDPNHIAAIEKPTTRLSVMLSEIESLGVWRMESKGWNAAAELPSMAELAMHVGDLVPATLGLAERSSIIQTDKGPQTSKYVVPFLDLHVTKKRLVEIVGGPGGVAAIEGAGGPVEARPALEAGTSAAASPSVAPDAFTPYFERVAAALDLDVLAKVWDDAKAEGLVGSTAKSSARAAEFLGAFKARAHVVKPNADEAPAPAPASTGPQPDAEGVYDAEVVPDEADTPLPPAGDDGADAVWQQILARAGQHQMTEADLNDDFAQRMGGLTAGEASAAELQAYLDKITEGAAA